VVTTVPGHLAPAYVQVWGDTFGEFLDWIDTGHGTGLARCADDTCPCHRQRVC